MGFTIEDSHLIKCLRVSKGYGAARLCKMFLDRQWNVDGSIDQQRGSDRPCSARMPTNINEAEGLALSQEDKPQTHSSQRKTARRIGISLGSVNTIIKNDLQMTYLKKSKVQSLTGANKLARFNHCHQLLRRFPASMTNFIWFTDEKLFTVETPRNAQNDCLYAPVGTHKKDVLACHLLRTQSNVSRSLMVSVGVSALGLTAIHFIDPGVKINGHYYRAVLQKRDLLPDIREFSDCYTFQQDSAPAYRARETIDLLAKETPDFILPTLWPPNSPDLNPVDYKIWSVMQEKVYRQNIRDVDELRERIVKLWNHLDQSVIGSAIRQWRT